MRARSRAASDGRATGPGRRGVVRPSISPLVWVGAAVWAASWAGTEIALLAWQASSAAAVWAGCAAVVALAVTSLLTRRPVVRLAAAAAACAMAVALAHGVGLAGSAARLDAAGPRPWTGLVVADPRVTSFGTSVTVRLAGAGEGVTVLLSWPSGVDAPAYGTIVGFDARLRAVVRGSAGAGDAFRSGELLRGTPWRVTSVEWAAGPFGAVAKWRDGAVAAMRAIGGRGGPALASMVFGAPAVGEGVAALEDARAAGVGWAITTSGVHLGVIVLLAERLASLLGAGRRGRAGAMAVALGVVSVAAGLRLSLLRAAVVAAAAAIGRLAGRRRDATAALGLAVVALVSLDAAAAYDVGLLLGIAAVSAIALLAPLVKEWLAPLGEDRGPGSRRPRGRTGVGPPAVGWTVRGGVSGGATGAPGECAGGGGGGGARDDGGRVASGHGAGRYGGAARRCGRRQRRDTRVAGRRPRSRCARDGAARPAVDRADMDRERRRAVAVVAGAAQGRPGPHGGRRGPGCARALRPRPARHDRVRRSTGRRAGRRDPHP
jgi:hypothetical protein